MSNSIDTETVEVKEDAWSKRCSGVKDDVVGTSRDIAVETVENEAYTWSCRCPVCNNKISRGSEEETKFCEKCGQKLYIRAFTKEEIDDALFQHEMDEYED